MKKIIFCTISLFFTFIISSCEGFWIPPNEALVGTWNITKAKSYQFFCSQNIINKYNHTTLQLLENKNIILIDSTDSVAQYTGTWQLTEAPNYNSENTQNNQQVFLLNIPNLPSKFEPLNQANISFYGSKKVTLSNILNTHSYTFTLQKK